MISKLVLGTMEFGKRIDTRAAMDIVGTYVDLGGATLETADCYSAGLSEQICGLALRTYPELSVITKVGREVGNERGYSSTRVRTSLNGSLARLGRESIDLLILHEWDPATPIQDAMIQLKGLAEDGVIRAIGLGNMPVRVLAAAAEIVDATWPTIYVSGHYSLGCRDVEAEILPLCRESNWRFLPWSPLSGGLLGAPDRVAPPNLRSDSRRDRPVGKRGWALEQLVGREDQVNQALSLVAARTGLPAPAVALAWLLSRQPVHAVCLGVTDGAQLRTLFRAADISLAPDDATELEVASRGRHGYPYDFLREVLPPAALPALDGLGSSASATGRP